MKQTIRYEAEDGKIFNEEEECIKYDKILAKVNKFLDNIPSSNSTDFANGNGYIQHKPATRSELIVELVKLSNEWFQTEPPFTNFTYALGRYIDDSNMKALNSLTSKIMFIDGNTNREYGQPYYANNPHKAKDIQLN